MTARSRWRWLAPLTIFPVTAALHQMVFFRANCMLNPFKGVDYYPSVIATWLQADPSLPWAIAIAFALYLFGENRPLVQTATKWFLVSFIPLSIWIWDIPGTGRWICHSFHDGRIGLHTRHLYLLGMSLWALFLGADVWRQDFTQSRSSRL